jgi:hypothetical protein
MTSYADLALLQAHLSASSDGAANFTSDDTVLLQKCLDAATGMIDFFTGRKFVAESAATKYFVPSRYDALDLTPDIRTVTSVTVDDDGDLTYGLTLAANTDYWLEPLQGFPDPGIYNRIVIAPRSSQAFSPGYRVRVVGDWGYVVGGQAPASVVEACLLQAARLYNRRGSPFGILQSTDLTTFARLSKADSDVQALLQPYRAVSRIGAGVY